MVVDASASPTIVGAPSLKETLTTNPLEDQVLTLQNNSTSQGGSLETPGNEDELNRCKVDSHVEPAETEDLVTDSDTMVVSPSFPTIDTFASITVLENMCNSPSIICINNTIETPTPEPAQKLSTASTSQKIYSGAIEGACIVEPDLGSNKFASLIDVEEEEEDSPESEEIEPMDFLIPVGKKSFEIIRLNQLQRLEKCIHNPHAVDVDGVGPRESW